ncbi:DUF2514 family protein [Comamonas sp. NoAH]|uniref:DUF2514 family protein n=1 Tax=Comamonas halotolerans TaxID=3041496 RepID=UPI0024E0BB73|nr:DUF2514 family protein [Comamonas sp. NoAH]
MSTRTLVLVVGGALMFGAGWTANGWRFGQDLAEQKAAHIQELASRDLAAFLVGQTINTNYQEALNDAIQEQARLAGAASAAQRNAGRLRDQLREADVRISAASSTAVRDYAATANNLLGSCSQRYTELAERADGHALDARICRRAWPREWR